MINWKEELWKHKSLMKLGDIGEHIALQRYGGELAPPGTKGYDLIDPYDNKIQVKTRNIDKKQGTARIDGIYKDCLDFNMIAVILLDNYEYIGTYEISKADFIKIAGYDPKKNMYYKGLSKKIIKNDTCKMRI